MKTRCFPSCRGVLQSVESHCSAWLLEPVRVEGSAPDGFFSNKPDDGSKQEVLADFLSLCQSDEES